MIFLRAAFLEEFFTVESESSKAPRRAARTECENALFLLEVPIDTLGETSGNKYGNQQETEQVSLGERGNEDGMKGGNETRAFCFSLFPLSGTSDRFIFASPFT